MPNIKISELSAPIAVTDSDLIPGVQSGVTRRLTWGGLKSTLAGALGRSYLGLGTAAVATLATGITDTTPGRAAITGLGGIGLSASADPIHNWPNASLNDCTGAWAGFSRTIGSTADRPAGFSSACVISLQIRQVVPGVVVAYTQVVTDNTTGATAIRSSGGVGTVAAPNWLPWRYSWDSSGANAITVDTGSFGYGTGSGGTATQATSKATGVPLNKPSGQITTAGNALAANTVVSFTLTNNKIAANDIPKVVIKSGATAGAYVVQVDAVAAGSCRISIRNMTAGSLSETLVLQFNIEKGAIA